VMQQNFRVRRIFSVLALALFFLGLLAFPISAFAQGCALCYTQAASAGAKMIQALRSGILILIVPPTLGSVAMIFIVHRKRNQVRRTDYINQGSHDW
jgi:hypothetical protein